MLRATRRCFSSTSQRRNLLQKLFFETPSQTALTEEFAGLPAASPAKRGASAAQVSTLSNGLKVVSQDSGAAVASVGLYLTAGSRYESVPGTSQVLEFTAYNTTQKRSALKLYRDVEEIGASVGAKTSRELFSYTGSVLRDGANQLTEAIAEAATQPRLKSWDVSESKDVLSHLLETTPVNGAAAVTEAVHAAAFGSSTGLGHATYATTGAQLEGVDADVIRSFLGARFTAKNAVLVASNVEHNELLDIADKYLGSLPEGVASSSATASAPGVHGPAPAAFVGGQSFIPAPTAGVAQVAIALPAPGLNGGAKGVAALSVLQALLGGSAAPWGLGAGFATSGAVAQSPSSHARIPRSLHNEAHSFIRTLTSFALPYSDVGVLGLVGSAGDHEAGRLVDAMAGFLKDAAGVAITAQELSRAKAQAKLAYLSKLEGAKGEVLAAQTLLGAAKTADALAAIDALTAADVQAVAKQALAGSPAIAASGSLATVPRYDLFTTLLK